MSIALVAPLRLDARSGGGLPQARRADKEINDRWVRCWFARWIWQQACQVPSRKAAARGQAEAHPLQGLSMPQVPVQSRPNPQLAPTDRRRQRCDRARAPEQALHVRPGPAPQTAPHSIVRESLPFLYSATRRMTVPSVSTRLIGSLPTGSPARWRSLELQML